MLGTMSLESAAPKRLSKGEAVALFVVVTGFAVVFALIAHHDCTTLIAGPSAPEPGTPRANYCGVADAAFPIPQVFGPALLLTGALLIGRRRIGIAVSTALVLGFLTLAHMVLASQLDAALPW
jgi:hypothetical protein